MKFYDIVRRSGRSLKNAKMRTVLTSLAIAVGAFTVTLALAAGSGGKAYMNEMLATSGDNLALRVYPKITRAEAGLPEYGTVTKSSKPSVLSVDEVAAIEKIEGVVDSTPFYRVESQFVTRGEGYKKLVAPLEVRIDQTELKLAAGDLVDGTIPNGSIVIPQSYVEQLGFSSASESIGKKMTIRVAQFDTEGEPTEKYKDIAMTIAAVDRQKDSVVYYQPAVRLSAEDGRQLNEYQAAHVSDGGIYGVSVRVKDVAAITSVQSQLQHNSYEVYSLEDTRSEMMQFLMVAQWGMIGFGAIAVLASIFGIVNTQYVSVLERTQEIGLLKSLGVRSRDIARLFRYEAALVGLLGGLAGTIFAVLVGLANPFISEQFGMEATTKLLIFEPLNSVVLIVILMAIAVAAGYFPARKAAKLDPIEALRTE